MRKTIIALIGATALLPAAASAQSNVEGRVGKLESEMRAVQRKVFPGGAGATLQPEIVGRSGATQADGVPATSAVADLGQRVTALESQMASMTDQIEQNGYKTRQLQTAFDAYKRVTDERLKAIEAGPRGVSAAAPIGDDRPGTMGSSIGGSSIGGSSTGAVTPSRGAAAPARPTTKPEVATKPAIDPTKTTSVGGVDKPATGDTPEDEYLYGYRLWAAKKYPEAEAQLKKVVATYPKHRRASYAQNLLGRSYLDEGKPSLASMAFYDNYKKMPDGERAPESLYYLAQALVQLKKPADACKVYGELTDVYATKISSSLKANVEKGRTTAKCD